MKFQFEVPDEVAEAYTFLSKRAEFFGLSPRLLTTQLYMRALEIEKQRVAITTPEVAGVKEKESAEERKVREQKEVWAQREEAALAYYRESGNWPIIEHSADGKVFFRNQHLSKPDSFSPWTPPDDYPHMSDYEDELLYLELTPTNKEKTK